jgi:acyl-ACP thioesterase
VIDDPVPYPASGRVYRTARRVRLGDVTPSGRLRLDALARYLQDVATDDALDGRYDDPHGWVVRRTRVWVARFPRYLDELTLHTWCGGVGSHHAERRTQLRLGDAPVAEAAALWVHVDLSTMRPARLAPDFGARFAEAAAGRSASARLEVGRALPRPSASGGVRTPWPLRAADMDAVGHMNNAAYWVPVEEWLAARPGARAPMHVTLEHHGEIRPGDAVEVLAEDAAGLAGPGAVALRHLVRRPDGDEVAAVALVRPLA